MLRPPVAGPDDLPLRLSLLIPRLLGIIAATSISGRRQLLVAPFAICPRHPCRRTRWPPAISEADDPLTLSTVHTAAVGGIAVPRIYKTVARDILAPLQPVARPETGLPVALHVTRILAARGRAGI